MLAGAVGQHQVVEVVFQFDAVLLHVFDRKIIDRHVMFFEIFNLAGQPVVRRIQPLEHRVRVSQRCNGILHFRELVLKSKATVLLQGTILTDIEETAAGIKRQHNVFEQIGIDPKKAFGYKISEPLIELRKDGVRKVGMALGLQKSLFDRIPFPGPALAARVIGEVTPMKIALVRKATVIVDTLQLDGLRVRAWQRPSTGLCPAAWPAAPQCAETGHRSHAPRPGHICADCAPGCSNPGRSTAPAPHPHAPQPGWPHRETAARTARSSPAPW